MANFPLTTSSPAHPEVISGGSWVVKEIRPQDLQMPTEPAIDARKVGHEAFDALIDELAPKSPAPSPNGPDCRLTYNLQVATADTYRFWLRAGFEYVRAPMRWRIDGGEWHAVLPAQLSHDMTELSLWTEIGWLDCGTMTLTAGAHKLELWATEWNITMGVDKKTGKPKVESQRFLLALDCLALVAGDWWPSASLKPGEPPSRDIDRQAADQVFKLPPHPGTAARTEVSLTGLWQVSRHDDPNMSADPYGPQKALPPVAQQVWRGCTIPPNPWRPLPAEIEYAHRVWYRARVDIPAEYTGRGFLLHFFGTNWIASVVINGQYIGYHKGVRVPWDIDISAAIKPGQVNEICVGIKDLWYGIDSDKPLDQTRNMPLSFVQQYRKMVAPFFPSTKGDADGSICGITDWVNLVATGPIYTANVAIRPSVANKSLTVVATIRNSTKEPTTVDIGTEAVFTGSGQVEHHIPPVSVTVPAGGQQEVTLSAPWEEPKIWWPNQDPAPIYQLHTTVTHNGQVLDVFEHEQTFGFREVTIDGIYLRINGLRYNAWNLLGGLRGNTEAEMLAHFRAGNNRFERFGDDLGLRAKLGPRCYQLDWTDKHGIPGRLSTMIDGMSIAYDLRNPVTWANFRDHIDQVTRAYRNHPSVLCYSLENELLLINGRLGNGNAMPQIEARAAELQTIAHANDPTRPCMLDGAGALQDNSMDICNTHYAEDGFFPDNARPLGDTAVGAPGVTVDPNTRGTNASGFIRLWTWDRQRPYCAGEIAYFSGNNPGHAWIGGETAAQDRPQARRGYARYVRYLFERYRWNDVAMTFPWVSGDDLEECLPAMSPLAAFTREYNTAFFGGTTATRTVKVFNDTFSQEPVTFAWRAEIDGKVVAGATQSLAIDPGFGRELEIAIPLPKVLTRTPLQLVLEARQPGSAAFIDTKSYAVFPVPALALSRPVYLLGSDANWQERLRGLGANPLPLNALGAAPAGALVLIPPNFPGELPAVTDFVRRGGRVICLEQRTPYADDRTPSPLRLAPSAKDRHDSACWVFSTGLQTPIFAGLAETDFSNWAGFSPTANALWQQPDGLSVSRLAAGSNLEQCALVEQPCGAGLFLASQMAIGDKWAHEPAAQTLLANMLTHADRYRAANRLVSVIADSNTSIAPLLRALGCRLSDITILDMALADAKTSPILVVEGSHDNVKQMLAARDTVEHYQQAGGSILLWGLRPDALADFNALMDTRHVMREFRAERVRLVRDPILAGTTNADVSLLSNAVLAPWANMNRVSDRTFTACIDAGNDIAPFCFGPFKNDYEFGDGGGHLALVNGLTNADFWRYIDQGGRPRADSPFVVFRLPSPCQLDHITIWNNANYDTIKDLDILVDGKKIAAMVLPDSYGSVDLPLDGITARSTVSLVVQSTHRGQGLIGLDQVVLTRQTPDWARDRVVPLVDIGGLVRYPRGDGGLILSLLNVTSGDAGSDKRHKMSVISAILHNLNAAFDLPDAPASEWPTP